MTEIKETFESGSAIDGAVARRAWADAFEVAANLANHHKIINHYSDRSNAFIETVTKKFLEDGTIEIDEYENNFLVAILVAHDVLEDGLSEVKKVRNRFRRQLLQVKDVASGSGPA